MQLMPGATTEEAKTYWNARNFTGDETQGTELKEQLKKEGCKRAKERDDRFDTQKNIAWAGELLKKHKGYVQNLLRRQESYPVADIFQRLIVSYRDGPKAAAEKKYGPNNYYQKVCDAAGTPTCTSWKITSILEYLKEQTKRIRKR
ncbi:MAG: hypothetical protein KC548_02195, partial [Nanoarchaeota archaeon]|nr:hypothetical protein [Nanoarchaeota archaeon]